MLVAAKPGIFFGVKCNPGDRVPDKDRWDPVALQSNMNQGMVTEVFDKAEAKPAKAKPKAKSGVVSAAVAGKTKASVKKKAKAA